MARTDFVADFITVIRNAQKARKDKVSLQTSNLTTQIAELLKAEGFVSTVKTFSDGKKPMIRIHLKYLKGKKPAIQGIRRISKPGLRKYSGHDAIPRVLGGLGVAIVSTSKGVLTGRKAREDKVGGEVLCTVW